MKTPKEIQQQVIKIVQTLLADVDEGVSIDAAIISEKIDQVLKMQPSWAQGLDRDAVTDELIRRFSVWVGEDSTLKNEAGHIAWLNAERKDDWRYWQRYREYMESSISETALIGLDKSTDHILGLLEDPKCEDAWDRRGLVVGHVQSGKTGNYTGVICKAADAGYKIIIVLAGLHNNLRSQTQMRLDEGFLGYETKPNANDLKRIGVGDIDTDPSIRPNYATNRSNSGDFNRAVARSLGISPEERPWLFVVKKNKSVLTLLLNWIRNRVANVHDRETGRSVVTNLPLLLIDDEADHASVDTGENVVDENGQPDTEHEPKAINRLIRRILHSFTRSAYVGYTATPFANIFIHERGATVQEGPDLFPSSFIINLSAPSSYVGPGKLFGIQSGDAARPPLPLTRPVGDYVDSSGVNGWMPSKHKSTHVPLWEGQDLLAPSVREAINAFILTCAARLHRGQQQKHSSMLIHVTRFNAVQAHVWRQVDTYVNGIRQRLERNIDSQSILLELEDLWKRDFVPTSKTIAELSAEDAEEVPTWGVVSSSLVTVCADITVRKINGTAKDVLDYAENEGTGLKVIVIGGDKLARGLTLEGLTTSYFLRASKMYDTLMQMGRWFGYRPGYLDLSRLYTTSDLIGWFRHIAEASEELRRDFDLMAQSGATPIDYGLRVQSHPVLLVTSQVKMRAAKNLMLSFSGESVETVALFRDQQTLEKNFRALQTFLSQLTDPEVNPARQRPNKKEAWQGYLWNSLKASLVTDFLLNYKSHPQAYKVNTQLLSEFISNLNAVNELTKWTVALVGSSDGKAAPVLDDVSVGMLTRRADDFTDRYSIGRLLSPRDEAIDLDEQSWSAALALAKSSWKPDPASARQKASPVTPNGPSIRYVRGYGDPANGLAPTRNGLLLLYLLDPDKAEAEFPSGTPPVVALGVSFPGSKAGVKVEYKVNNVLWEQEYGQSE